MTLAGAQQGPDVVIVPTGAANVASVMAAVGRVGARGRIAKDASEAEGSRLVIVPGVGSFGAAMARLRQDGTDRAIASRVRGGRPTLGICLGLQVMFEASAESPGVAGLGVVPGRVERFVAGRASGFEIADFKCQRRAGRARAPSVMRAPVARVPQMGWNGVEVGGDGPGRSEQRSAARVIQTGAAYFANSYRVTDAPDGWAPAMAEHAGRFVAGLERGAVVLCQFHPELSGPWGLSLIRRWIATGVGDAAC